MNTSKYIILPALVGMAVLGSAGTAHASENVPQEIENGRRQEMRAQVMQKREAYASSTKDMKGDKFSKRLTGEITAINGVVLSMKVTGPEGAIKTLEVNTAGATFKKVTFDATATTTKPAPTTQTIADLAIGEKIAVEISSKVTKDTKSVTATTVIEMSGDMPARPEKMDDKKRSSSTKPIMKDGKRGIVGEVIAISGTTLTIKAMNNTVYSVSAEGAEVKSGTTTATLADITVGERIAVRGETTDTTIKAAMIMTDIPEKPASDKASERGKEHSLIGKVGSFFGKLFGK